MEEIRETPNGILLMHKPQGFTSHDVVAKLRGILHTRKIGHGGTLDPLATGVLPVFVGGATKAADFAAVQAKTYEAGFMLGAQTDTQDSTGTVIAQSQKRATRAQVETALIGFLGAQKQVPPMYSAIKIDGKKLYDLARAGKEVARAARDIVVTEAQLLSFDEQTQTGAFRVRCSKGTYVRTIVDDLGHRLGTFAHMTALVRTVAGEYTLERCHSFDTIEQAVQSRALSMLLLPVDSLFLDKPILELNDEGAERAARGAIAFARQLMTEMPEVGTICRVYHAGKFLMLGQIKSLQVGGEGLFVYKNFR